MLAKNQRKKINIFPQNNLEYFPKDIYAKLADFFKNVLQPLWPTISKLERAPRKCAMLISFGSQLFGEKIWGAYGYSSGFAYYAALQMAHIPTDIIFDENIQRGELSKYKVLFMHDTTNLPKSVFDAVAKFADKGGMVVCGEPFAKKSKAPSISTWRFPNDENRHTPTLNPNTDSQPIKSTRRFSTKRRKSVNCFVIKRNHTPIATHL